jgi:hypothetical protein
MFALKRKNIRIVDGNTALDTLQESAHQFEPACLHMREDGGTVFENGLANPDLELCPRKGYSSK